MSVRDALMGRTVTHGNLTGKVTAVTPDFITVVDPKRPGMPVRVPVPAHLRDALLEDS